MFSLGGMKNFQISNNKLVGILILFLVCALSQISVARSATVSEPQRKALVIGNSDYKFVDRLSNPRNDAIAVHDRIQKLGFSSRIVLDANRETLDREINLFIDGSTKKDTLFLFYAGHGFQSGSANLIAPTDLRIDPKSGDIKNSINLSVLFQKLVKNSKIRILFLDACRNDPLKDSQVKTAEKPVVTRAISTRAFVGYRNGFTQMKGAEPGTFIAYSTASGSVAADGVSEVDANSPFTKSFLRHVENDKIQITELMQNITRDVYVETSKIKQSQTPWSESSLLDPFFFANGKWKQWLSTQLQTQLKTANCYTGAIDGDWGPGSRRAMADYNAASGSKLPENGSSLAALQHFRNGKKKITCPQRKERVKPSAKSVASTGSTKRRVSSTSGSSTSKCIRRAQRYCSNPDNSSAIGYAACMTHAKRGCRE